MISIRLTPDSSSTCCWNLPSKSGSTRVSLTLTPASTRVLPTTVMGDWLTTVSIVAGDSSRRNRAPLKASGVAVGTGVGVGVGITVGVGTSVGTGVGVGVGTIVGGGTGVEVGAEVGAGIVVGLEMTVGVGSNVGAGAIAGGFEGAIVYAGIVAEASGVAVAAIVGAAG